MGKGLTTLQKTEIAKSTLKTRTLITISLDSGSFRILANDSAANIAINSNTYYARMVETSGIETSLDGTTDTMSISVSDIAQEFSGLVAEDGDVLTNRGCKVEEVILYDVMTVNDFVTKFKSIVNNDNAIELLAVVDSATGTTLKDYSGKSRNMTLSKDISQLDPATTGFMKSFNVNASDEWFDTPDVYGLSFGNGSTDEPFSIVSYINPNSWADVSNSRVILGKYIDSGGREYLLYSSLSFPDKIGFKLYDSSANAAIGRYYNSSLSGDIGSFHSYIGTYNGNNSASGIKIYRDGFRVDNTDTTTNPASYVAMENLGAKVGNYLGSKTSVMSAKYGIAAIIRSELTQSQVTELDNLFKVYSSTGIGIIDNPVTVFDGKINKIQLTAKSFVFTVERILNNYSSLSPNMIFDVNCQWKFKDTRCTYSGGETKCDKTLTRCQALSNVTNFGGYPSVVVPNPTT